MLCTTDMVSGTSVNDPWVRSKHTIQKTIIWNFGTTKEACKSLPLIIKKNMIDDDEQTTGWSDVEGREEEAGLALTMPRPRPLKESSLTRYPTIQNIYQPRDHAFYSDYKPQETNTTAQLRGLPYCNVNKQAAHGHNPHWPQIPAHLALCLWQWYKQDECDVLGHQLEDPIQWR